VSGIPTLRASEAGAALDTDLLAGGGTDDTAVLQALLDRAARDGSAHVVIDGPAAVSGLAIHGNTTIEFPPGAGLYLRDGSRRAALRNHTSSRDGIVDRGIRIRGGFFNGNRDGQVNAREGSTAVNRDEHGGYQRVLEFFGVEDLVIEGVTIWNPRAYAMWIANARHVVIRDTVVDVNIPPYPGDAPLAEQREWWTEHRSNLDGIHVTGPASHLLLERLRLRTDDDALAFCANESVGADITDDDTMGPYLGHGPISDVTIRDVVFDDALQGIRLLSADQPVDRVLVENLSGTIRHRLVVASHFGSRVHGRFGSLVFRGVAVDPQPSATWHDLVPEWRGGGDRPVSIVYTEEADLALFSINSPVDRLAIEGMALRAVDARPLLRLGERAEVGTLEARIALDDPRGVAVAYQPEPGSRVRDLTVTVRRVDQK
jgi:hypothetical protein